jgi:heat shock protein HtpX
MSVNDLFATHPPLPDRIHILRAMSGASYADYEKSYENVTHSKVIPGSALTDSGAVGVRQASAGAQAGEVQDKIDRTRETSDLMWRMNNYKTLDCENCGTRLRLPPSYNEPSVRCPHCGHINRVNQ